MKKHYCQDGEINVQLCTALHKKHTLLKHDVKEAQGKQKCARACTCNVDLNCLSATYSCIRARCHSERQPTLHTTSSLSLSLSRMLTASAPSSNKPRKKQIKTPNADAARAHTTRSRAPDGGTEDTSQGIRGNENGFEA